MNDKLHVSLVTPSQSVAKGAAEAVVAPSVLGQVTILPGHAPLLAELSPGVVELRGASQNEAFYVSGGFLQVERDRVSVLAEAAEAVSRIDVERARKQLLEAEEALKKADAAGPEVAALQLAVERARQRVAAARPQA